GTAPRTFTESGLPEDGGLTLSSAGIFSGTPDADDVAASPFIVTVTCTDDAAATADEAFQVTVSAVPGDIFLIPTTQGTVDCRSVQPLQAGGTALPGPGDVIVLDGTTRGRLLIRDCTGTESSPIIVRNDTSESDQLTI